MVTLNTLDTISAYDAAEKSRELIEWLRLNVAVGFTTQRGFAWHAGDNPLADGSHFPGPVPDWRVQEILGVPLVEAEILLRFPDGTVVPERMKEYTDADGNKELRPIRKAIARLDTMTAFYYASDGYKIHPYLQVLDGFIRQIAHDDHAGVGSVGLLQEGGMAFLQAVLPETYEVHGFGYQPYITGGTSANGKSKTLYFTGAKAAICDNTYDMAKIAGINLVGVRHTRNSMPNVSQMRDRLGLHLADVAQTMSDTFESLMSVEVSDEQWKRFVDVHDPLPERQSADKPGQGWTMANNRRERLNNLYYNDPKVAPWNGTLFGALQATNTDRTWNSIVRNADGGRWERNLEAMVTPKAGDMDAKVIAEMSQVLGLELARA